MELSVKVDIFSPRWQHDDRYEFILKEESLEFIGAAQKKAKCIQEEGQDPKWIGFENIERILSNDSICSPINIESLVEFVWTSWKDGEINDDTAKEAIESLATWINDITKTKPSTEFWNRYF